MDAKPFLVVVGRALEEVGLEVVLIGNAAAALQGTPVTTVERLKRPHRNRRLAALRRESERALGDAIRRWQRLPSSKRTHFLCERVAWRISCL